jgi:hypothetical protein
MDEEASSICIQVTGRGETDQSFRWRGRNFLGGGGGGVFQVNFNAFSTSAKNTLYHKRFHFLPKRVAY